MCVRVRVCVCACMHVYHAQQSKTYRVCFTLRSVQKEQKFSSIFLLHCIVQWSLTILREKWEERRHQVSGQASKKMREENGILG